MIAAPRTTDVDGVTVSTIPNDRGYFETCLFDDRNGKGYGNRSRVVETYADESLALNGHLRWSARTVDHLVTIIGETYA